MLEQSTLAELPRAWRDLRPPKRSERQAAAAFLRLADCQGWEQMQQCARAAARDIARQRQERSPELVDLWSDLEEALDRLAQPMAAGAPGLLSLALWREEGLPLLDEIYSPFRGLVPRQPELRLDFLAAIARVLLKARARSWIDQASRAENRSGEEEGS